MADALTVVAGVRRHVLTAVEFDVLWKRLGLGPTPVVLRLPSPGRTDIERRRIVSNGWQALRDRGLAGPGGPDPELARLVHLLARPTEQLELRGVWRHGVRAVAAGRPEEAGTDGGTRIGVLAVRQDATVTLESCGSLPAGLLTVLPAAAAGHGRAATVATSLLGEALRAPGTTLRAALIGRGVPASDAGLLARMLIPGRGRAQIVALGTDATGVTRRSGGVLGVLDGPRGRFLMTRTTGPDGVEWTTVAPTDSRRLRHRITDLLAGASSAAAP